ncbi:MULTISPECIES: LPXTG cell wall anchor domain-containing protein [unclassified Streptomyces]|uniref:LPXTG cell wall anchor domain-containing protein n=1 Tax=unclassified Streptomyces TaxID=2593676 RepID=UPI00247358A7|nr:MULTISPECIES: LPXTG cell wall anchor domain-containing protein [unclassified Streptomyces]MDH6450764.1 LPXTG-motif cell wall-anchored protein [Streptomyces sp. SAI-119]MDH6498690.1 LPXTG-motif cell wall-anchored protein [Streptomyces sp. SAI-149]
MRTLTRFGVLSAVTSAAFLVAPVAHATAPGDNGTVKIHDATTGEELRKNEPHVCTFYLDAFGFDAVQEVDWHIEAWAPTADVKGETVKSGEITLDADGHGRTEDLSLPDGHYKLFWNFDGEKGAAKHKVFWTDCEDEQGGGGGTATPTTSATPTASATPGQSASPTTGPGAEPSESTEAGASASASSSASAQGSTGDLAETGNGAPVGLLSGLAAALVAAGGYLVVRRRRA